MRPYTFKQIQTFMEVARHRSVSKAAERLFVIQAHADGHGNDLGSIKCMAA